MRALHRGSNAVANHFDGLAHRIGGGPRIPRRGAWLLVAQHAADYRKAETRRGPDTREKMSQIMDSQVVQAGLAVWSGGEGPRSLIVRGQSKLLEEVSAQEDLERVRQLFDDLETKNDLVKLLDLAKEGEGVRIFIGAETKLFSLSGSSVIVAPYMNGAQKIVGVIGVIGPQRLNYARIIPMVDYTAQVVGRLLS